MGGGSKGKERTDTSGPSRSGGGAGGRASGKRRSPGGGGGNASRTPRHKMSSSTGSKLSKTPVPRFSTSSRDEEFYERSLVEGVRGSRPHPASGLGCGDTRGGARGRGRGRGRGGSQ